MLKTEDLFSCLFDFEEESSTSAAEGDLYLLGMQGYEEESLPMSVVEASYEPDPIPICKKYEPEAHEDERFLREDHDCMWHEATKDLFLPSFLLEDFDFLLEDLEMFPSYQLTTLPESASTQHAGNSNYNATVSSRSSTTANDKTLSTETTTTSGHLTTSGVQKAPYTPGNDHCYSQPLSAMQQAKRITIKEEEDSEISDVDVETVTEEPRPRIAVVRPVGRPNTKGRSQRENVPPRRTHAYTPAAIRQQTRVNKRTKQQLRHAVGKRRGRRPANSLQSSPGSSRSNSDTEEPVKRSVHNNMERMRREQQKHALHHLRQTIPELQYDCKAPKVKILYKAQQYVKYLETFSRQQQELIQKLLNKRLLLTKKLDGLKKRGKRQ